MFSKLLGLLAWAGLWQPQLVVLNSNNPPSPRLGTNATEMVHTTSRFMDALVDNFVNAHGQKVSYMALEHSTFYRQSFSEFGTLLRNTNPLEMNQAERKAFFINLYNILTIHAILHHDPLPESTISVPSFWSRYAYKVGPYLLHLDHIEHGILRGNRAHPSSGKVMFSHDDPRMALSLLADRRIHGALNCGAMSCPPLKSYDSDKLEVELNYAMSGFCNRGVKLNNEGQLIINSIFEWFRVDFGATEPAALRWLAECVDDQSIKQALRQAAVTQRGFSYDYNWTINAA